MSQLEVDSFLTSQIQYLTIMGAFQHARIYSTGATDADRRRVRETLWRKLGEITHAYVTGTRVEDEHVATVARLADEMSEECRPALAGGRFRVGIAQKALNLYLKYLWCLGRLRVAPPHCPFDRTVIQALPRHHDVSFSKFDDLQTYRDLVAAAREAADGQSLAEWELALFNDAQD